jgi:hypothetical protein
MANKLFSSTDRDTAHRKLEEVLAAKEFPAAECREDHNVPDPYQVWDGPEIRVVVSATLEPVAVTPENALALQIAKMVVEMMLKKTSEGN